MTNAYLELARRCEEASGPDRELDAEIAKAIGIDPIAICDTGNIPFFSPYTASLDAAMSLVPDGWSVGLGDLRGYDPIIWRAHLRDHNDPDAMKRKWVEGHAPTPALALCASALRAQTASLRAKGAGEDDRRRV